MKFRGDGLDLCLLLSNSILEYCCFYGRQTAPPPCILVAPGIMSRSQHSRTLVMSQTASLFPSLRIILRIQNSLFSCSASFIQGLILALGVH